MIKSTIIQLFGVPLERRRSALCQRQIRRAGGTHGKERLVSHKRNVCVSDQLDQQSFIAMVDAMYPTCSRGEEEGIVTCLGGLNINLSQGSWGSVLCFQHQIRWKAFWSVRVLCLFCVRVCVSHTPGAITCDTGLITVQGCQPRD